MSEKVVISTIKKVMPAVVSVMIRKKFEDLKKEMPHEMYPFPPGDLKKTKTETKGFQIPDILVDRNGMVKVGGGTGFIVDPAGLILTNKHVIDDANAIYTVILNDGSEFPAEVMSRDPINDVAILRIGANRLPTVKLGDATKLELGQSVIAIGNALGMFKNTVSLGIISGLSRAVNAREGSETPSQELRGMIQSDAAINIGNSGGPLVNLRGEAIGINTAVISGAQNICFAIPINAAKKDLNDIKKHGRILRPLLGVRYIVIDDNLQAKMNLQKNYGAYVLPETHHDPGVTPGSPAYAAGIKEKDIILEFDKKKVTTDHPIQDYLEDMEVGDEVELKVFRDGKEFKVKVTLTERR